MNIKRSVLLIVALPLIGVVYFAAIGLSNKIAVANEAALTELSQTASELRQASEKEKEVSCLFLKNNGTKSVSELRAQRAETDKRAARLKDFFLKEFVLNSTGLKNKADIKQKYSVLMEKLAGLGDYRSTVSSRSISESDTVRYYTELGKALSVLQ